MKAFLLFSFILTSTLLFGQITNHFSHQDSKWNVAKTYPAATQEHPNFVATTTTNYGIQGDSIIGGETWSKIYSSSDSLFQNNLIFEGLTRAENDLVLFKSSANPVDTLYNFNLAVGDSVFYDFGFTTTWIHVEEIQTIQINGESYRKFIFSEPTGPTAFDHLSEVWIEGIGSIHGPLFPLSPRKFSGEIPDDLDLTCSYSLNQSHYNSPNYPNCYVDNTLGINNVEVLNLNVYPNPVNSVLTIESSQNISGDIEIYDLNGKLIQSINSKEKETTIDVSGFENGVYFLNFPVGERKVVWKVLVGE